jgi:hypothetical protein
MQRVFGGVVRRVEGAGRGGLVLAALVALGACGDNSNSVAPLTATTLTVNAATNAQTGVVGTVLTQAVGVLVLDQNGAPLPNATVNWAIESGGGGVASPTSTTDASGNATVVWTLGTTAGTDSVKASLASGAIVFIAATATAGPAAQIAITSGNTQTVTAGTVTAPLIVQVVDQFSNPVPNATVTWAAAGGGTLSATTTTTDSTGTTQVTLSTGMVAANYSVTATTGTLAPVSFTITAL